MIMNGLTKWWNKEETDPWKMLSRWDPLREMQSAMHRLEQAVGRPTGTREPLATAEWSPLVDITEDEKEYAVKAELPDVKKDDIKVTVQDNTLYITGERKTEKEEKGKRYHRIERSYGSFERSFTLPEDADPKKITSDFRDGVLTVHLGKSPETQPKSIEVKVS
jgi:HSP20 family protein